MGFSRQEYWSGLPCPPPGDLPNSEIKAASSASPTLQVDSLWLSHQGSPISYLLKFNWRDWVLHPFPMAFLSNFCIWKDPPFPFHTSSAGPDSLLREPQAPSLVADSLKLARQSCMIPNTLAVWFPKRKSGTHTPLLLNLWLRISHVMYSEMKEQTREQKGRGWRTRVLSKKNEAKSREHMHSCPARAWVEKPSFPNKNFLCELTSFAELWDSLCGNEGAIRSFHPEARKYMFSFFSSPHYDRIYLAK